MNSFETLISKLDEDHKEALKWFQENKDKEIRGWPEEKNLKYFLATRAKGIFKPRQIKYALSFRSSVNGPYDDNLEQTKDGKFKFKYFQENKDVRKRDFEFTNRAVKHCINDVVPVGIIIQKSPKPDTKYLVLGTGVVKKWENGYFFVNGFDKNGDI